MYLQINKKSLIKIIILFGFLVQGLYADQTRQWRVIWDANTETDMSHYIIYRGTTSNPTTQITTLNHPDTIYTDLSIVPGVNYFYRIKAVDTEGLESVYSDNVNAAIPAINSIPDQVINEGSSVQISLDNYVADPDGSDSAIDWTFSSTNYLNFSLDDNRRLTVTSDYNSWSGNIVFTATDADTFYSQDTVSFVVNATPQWTNRIADDTFNPGETIPQIDLDANVQDEDHSDAQLSFSSSASQHITTSINSSSHVVTFTLADPNWRGSEEIIFTVTDPYGSSTTDTVNYTINAAPQWINRLADAVFNPGETIPQIDLDTYVQDSNNSDSQLTFTSSSTQHILTNINSSSHVVTFSLADSDWRGSEEIVFTATDPYGVSSTDTVKYTVNTGPQWTSRLEDNVFNSEDELPEIDLDNYVDDENDNDSELIFTSSATQHILANINSNSHVVTFSLADPDWHGSEEIIFTVTDPFGSSANDTINYTLNAAPSIEIDNQVAGPGESFAPINMTEVISDQNNADTDLEWDYFNETRELSVSVEDQTVTVSKPSDDWIGASAIIFSVTDPYGASASDTVIFSTNGIPQIEIPNQLVQEGQSFKTFDLDTCVTDVDNEASELTWVVPSVDNENIHLTVDENNLVTVTAKTDWFSAEKVTFKVSDPQGAKDSLTVSFRINAQPVIKSSYNKITDVMQLFNYQLILQDPDSVAATTVQFESYPDFLNIESEKVLSGTPSVPDTGYFYITSKAEDSRGGVAYLTDTLKVEYHPEKPVLTAIDAQQVNEGEAFIPITLNDYIINFDLQGTVFWEVIHTDSDTLQITIDSNSVTTVVPKDEDWYGTEYVTFRMTNIYDQVAHLVAIYTAIPINDAPEITAELSQYIYQYDTFTPVNLNLYVQDVDNDLSELTWTAEPSDSVSITADNYAEIITPDSGWVGTKEILFRVSDPYGLSAEIMASFEVRKTIFNSIVTTNLGSGTTFEINWQTNINTKSQLQYGISQLDNETTPAEEFSKTHNVVLAGLTPNSTYQLRAVNTDSSGLTHYSKIYTIQTGQAGEINVFPNPYKAGTYAGNDYISFTNVPSASKIMIYNLLGDLVFAENEIDSFFRWNVRNNQQKKVQSGLYMYVVKDEDNKKIGSGKIVIIR